MIKTPCFLLDMLLQTNQCHQEHWQGGYQIFYIRQVFTPKHLNLILSVQHRHQMHSVVVFPLTKLPSVKTFGKFYYKPVLDKNFENFLLNLWLYAHLYILYAENRCLYDICCFIYIPVCASKPHMNIYQGGGGVEPTNGEIIPKIELAKWRLIEIIFPWEVLPPW